MFDIIESCYMLPSPIIWWNDFSWFSSGFETFHWLYWDVSVWELKIGQNLVSFDVSTFQVLCDLSFYF